MAKVTKSEKRTAWATLERPNYLVPWVEDLAGIPRSVILPSEGMNKRFMRKLARDVFAARKSCRVLVFCDEARKLGLERRQEQEQEQELDPAPTVALVTRLGDKIQVKNCEVVVATAIIDQYRKQFGGNCVGVSGKRQRHALTKSFLNNSETLWSYVNRLGDGSIARLQAQIDQEFAELTGALKALGFVE